MRGESELQDLMMALFSNNEDYVLSTIEFIGESGDITDLEKTLLWLKYCTYDMDIDEEATSLLIKQLNLQMLV